MFDIPGHEPVQICFQATDDEYKSVSIDMWPDSAAAIKSLASKSDVYQLHSALMEAASKAHNIAKQEQFQEDRQRIHT
jgi:formylmethanofuran dehydrogenase subunit B